MPVALGLANETKPNVSPSTTMGTNEKLNTISKRNKSAAIEMETLLWRALCDSPEAAKEYVAHDCVMINPLFAGTDAQLNSETEPSIAAVLDSCGGKWTGFRFREEPLVVEVGLMAVTLVYRLTLFRRSGRKGRVTEVDATACSSWRQTAGADWLVCAQHVAYADEDEDEDEDDEEEDDEDVE